jgi:Flp pilus assembly protein TadB
MSDNAEAGIARIQAAAAKAQGTQGSLLQEHQKRSVAYMDERILIFILALAFIGLIVVWATTTSPLVLYGSFAGVILLTVLWGVSRARSIERARQDRERQAREWHAEKTE